MITLDDLTDSNLDPVNGGSVKQLNIKSSTFQSDKKYMLAMKATDSAGNSSPVSNKAQIFIHSYTTTTTTTASPPSPPGCSDQLSFSSGENFPDGLVTCYDRKGIKDPFLSEDTLISSGTSCIFMSSGHLTEGLVIEMYCNDNIWDVSIMNA
eukprot:GFUD01067320.1.p1 GENE.GFUD01067320.1~~GFUD01067320.1.p1  ORF type:complete len:160 (-),score=46.31 GFUD01067320.1:120-575(-)